MRAMSALTALVPANRIFGEQPPTQPDFPFIRYGSTIALPDRADCLDGSVLSVTIHGFAMGQQDAARIGAQIAKLEGEYVTDGGDPVQVQWEQTRTVPDASGEQDLWHTIVDFEVIVGGEE